MNKSINFLELSSAQFINLPDKDESTMYITLDDPKLYLGEIMLGSGRTDIVEVSPLEISEMTQRIINS